MRALVVSTLILGMVLPSLPAAGPAAVAAELRRGHHGGGSGRPRTQTGWYWVYEGIAHAAFFQSTGTRIERLAIPLASPGGERPAAPLEVEIRDGSLTSVFARGAVAPEKATAAFRGVPVKLKNVATLTPGKHYILLCMSQDTCNTAPWLIGAVYGDTSPLTRHVGYADELCFELRFENGKELRVPHGMGEAPETVEAPAAATGTSELAPVVLAGPTPTPQIAAEDPLGPVPAIPGDGSSFGSEEETP